MKLFTIIILFLQYAVTIFPQWESIGPYGGYIRCLIKDNSGRVLSGNAYGGIFRTSDAGKNWEQLFTGYRNEDVRSLAVNSNNHIFAGTDLHGLYRSTNDGVSWERLINTVSTRTILDILIKSNGDIFLATFNGVYRSTDNGVTFSTASNGIPTSTIFSLGLSGNYIFAGTGNSGIFRSSDDGANWEDANNGITFSGRNVLDFSSADFSSAEFSKEIGASNIYATLSDKIVRSSDGINWDELPVPIGTFLHLLYRTNGDIVASGSSLISSNDQGNNWDVSSVPTNALLSSIVEIDGSTLIAGSQGPGTYATINNMTDWELAVNRMPATAVTGMNLATGAILVSTRHSGAFKTTNGGLSWFSYQNSIPAGWIYGYYKNPVSNTEFILHQNGLYRSTDGIDWSSSSYFRKTMAFNSFGNIFLGGGSIIYKSTDDGLSYQSTPIGSNVFNSLDIAIDQEDDIYVATANENGLQGKGIFKSSDNGVSYSPIVQLPDNITSIEPLDLTGISSTFDCIRDMLAADASGNFFAKNNDGSWNQFNIGFQQGGLVKDIAAVNYIDGAKITVITEKEMFTTSVESNCTFTQEEELPDDNWFVKFGARFGLGSEILNSGAATITEFVGTLGLGVLKRESVTDIKDIKNSISDHFDLQQNYPNPFNPSTTIQFSIPEQSFVKLEVFNALGEKVTTLVEEELNAGNYRYDWKAENLSSGIYLYKLQTPTFTESRKMTLLK
jgi:photosystem II stability/assembly factor-like uncharacterized protein